MASEFKYVSCVTGHLVPRYGTRSYIGASAKPGSDASFQPEAVVAIPLQEWNSFIKEYNRCVTSGALRARTKGDHQAWIKTQETAAAAPPSAPEGEQLAATPAAESNVAAAAADTETGK